MKTKVLSILLALIFLASGLAKLASLEFELVAFERWGYPIWFMYLIGVVEVAGGVGLIIQRFSAAAAAALALMMIGGIGTHVMHSEWGMLAAASLIFLMSTVRAYLGWEDLRVLISGLIKTKESSQ
ncbi:COG2259 Predicted membrane protein [Burkholderiales bacterium]